MIQNFNTQKELERRIVGSILSLESLEEQQNALFEIGNERYFESEEYREMILGITHRVVRDKLKVDSLNLYTYLKRHQIEISKSTLNINSTVYLYQDIMLLKQMSYKKGLIKDLQKKLSNLSEVESITEIEQIINEIILSLTSKSFRNESVLMDFQKLDKLLFDNLSKEKEDK